MKIVVTAPVLLTTLAFVVTAADIVAEAIAIIIIANN